MTAIPSVNTTGVPEPEREPERERERER